MEFGGWGSGWTDRPSKADVTGHAGDAVKIIASTKIGWTPFTVNGMEHPMPAMQAIVIRSHGTD